MARAEAASSPPAPATLRRLLHVRRAELRRVVLNVQTQVVYRSEDITAPFTVYILKVHDDAQNGGAAQRSSAQDWHIVKRYSECRAFHTHLLRLVKDGDIWSSSGVENGRVFLRSLRAATAFEFPRKHMRYDNQNIIEERRERLPDFVHALLTVYADLVLYFAWGAINGGVDRQSPLIARLRGILTELELFLSVPPKRKEADSRLLAAILTLENVGDANEYGDCCICLGDADGDDEDSGDELDGGEKEFQQHWARLPCEHLFHEGCVIRWFRANTSCPVCRCDPARGRVEPVALA